AHAAHQTARVRESHPVCAMRRRTGPHLVFLFHHRRSPVENPDDLSRGNPLACRLDGPEMKRAQRRQLGRGAFDVIEEATHLLRTAPLATLTTYYLGAIPFVLGLLFFWADMSRSPLAPQHIAGASFGLALLFFWMKFCQSLFARRVRAQAAHEVFLAPEFRRGLRIFFMQGIIQSTALFLLPLAAVPILPFGWTYAFYQSAGALDTGEDEGTSALMKKSWRQAKLW